MKIAGKAVHLFFVGLLFIPLSKTWSSGPGQSYLALPWDNSNSGFRCQVSGVRCQVSAKAKSER
ncbi:hypothetical protein D1AOALGA4SA_9478 [Olavius algarvensis Delta 1 endosymbiont]|nr:hypothetical protein D1AOALGA4SA_9478 [Olavius algarvensis Delta 1 endosymbiont]